MRLELNLDRRNMKDMRMSSEMAALSFMYLM
jgi:hypothetical protein